MVLNTSKIPQNRSSNCDGYMSNVIVNRQTDRQTDRETSNIQKREISLFSNGSYYVHVCEVKHITSVN